MRRGPSLFYQISARLNFVVWKLPLPRRLVVWLSQLVYRAPPMPGPVVLAIASALRDADVHCWISGGWGIDALAGKRTRTHRDLDLIVDDRDMQRALEVMRGLGYEEWYRTDSEVPLECSIVLHEDEVAARVVDLHPLALSGTEMEVATGLVEGRPVPCTSVDLQLKTHCGYRNRGYEMGDLALLRKLSEGSALRLIVPVPSAEHLVDDLVRADGMPAHINLVFPSLDTSTIDEETESGLASLLETVRSFSFALGEIRRLPGVICLAAEPAAPFVAVARAIAEFWPEAWPDARASQDIIPYLTVAYGTDTPIPVGLAERLPVSARAEEAWLMSKDATQWMCRRAFRLGG